MGRNDRKSGPGTDDPAFEQWVARQLHKMYDEVLAEEVPSELLCAVERLTGTSGVEDAKPNGAGPADQSTGADRRDAPGSRRR